MSFTQQPTSSLPPYVRCSTACYRREQRWGGDSGGDDDDDDDDDDDIEIQHRNGDFKMSQKSSVQSSNTQLENSQILLFSLQETKTKMW
jgi:hypothetical protein